MIKKYDIISIYCYKCHTPLEGEWGMEQFTGIEYGWAICPNCNWATFNSDKVLEIRQVAFDELMRA